MARELYVAWWNLENLFDVDNAPSRPAWLQKQLASELAGWDAQVLDLKLAQLTRGIAQMNGGAGPDLLGVCEVESRGVLEALRTRLHAALPARRYGIAHADTSDQRGIDVAFLYEETRFTARENFNRTIVKRFATRDVFQVNFELPGGTMLVAIGNHWPSRRGGQYESEPYRIIAAETVAYWHERILEKVGKDTPILVMGDFNDEPFDRSMLHYALSENVDTRVKSKRSTKPYLLNLMWPLLGQGQGTHFFDSWGMLDQVLVNRALLTGSRLRLVPGSTEILRPDWMLKGGKPRRFSRPSTKEGIDKDGASDHLPIGVRLREA